MTPIRSIRYLVFLNAAALGFNFWANVNNPNLIQYTLNRLAPPELNNTLLGLFAIAGLLVATVAQPLLGTLSDRTRGRYGRRAPFLVGGALGCCVMVLLITNAATLPLLLGLLLLNQVFSNTIQGPFQALMPDQVGNTQRGLSAGIKSLVELLAVILSGVAVQQLLARDQVAALAAVTIGVLLVPTLITAAFVRGQDSLHAAAPASRQLRPFLRELQRDPAHRDLRVWLLNRYTFWVGLILLRQFVIGYLRDVWGYTNNQALALNGEFIILLGVGVLIATLPGGYLSDRIGRARLIALSGLVAALGVGTLLFTRDLNLLRAIAVCVGAGAGLYVSVNWALVTALIPKAEAALFLGIANIATTAGSATAQLGGPFIDWVNERTRSTGGYALVFGVACAFFLLSAAVILRIRER